MCCCACAMPCCSLTGYAPVYPEAPWNAPEMHSVISALERVVCQHEPFPAIAMDRHWNVLMTNDAAPRFFDIAAARNGPHNMLLLIFDPQRMRPIRGRLGHCFTKLPATRASARQHLMLCRGKSEPDNSMPQLAAIRHIATVSPPEWCERPTTRERPLQFETCRSPHIVPKGRNGSKLAPRMSSWPQQRRDGVVWRSAAIYGRWPTLSPGLSNVGSALITHRRAPKHGVHKSVPASSRREPELWPRGVPDLRKAGEPSP